MEYKKIINMYPAHIKVISIKNRSKRKIILDFFINKYGFMLMPYKDYKCGNFEGYI